MHGHVSRYWKMNNERSIVLPINIDFREPGQREPWDNKTTKTRHKYSDAIDEALEQFPWEDIGGIGGDPR